MKNPENFSPIPREKKDPKETGDLSNDILLRIKALEEQEELERQRLNREEHDKLYREERLYEETIAGLRKQYKVALEIIRGTNWIDLEKLKKFGAPIPQDAFVLVKQVKGERIGPGCRGRDGSYEKIEVKFLRRELRKQFEDLLNLNPQLLEDMGVELNYKESVGGYEPSSFYTEEEQRVFSIRDAV